MYQSYKFNSCYTNKIKLIAIRKLALVYKHYYNKLSTNTISNFYKNYGSIPKFLPQIDFEIKELSESYKQACGRQVKGTISSWIANLKNKIKDKIMKSNLCKEDKKILCVINKYALWFKKEVVIKDKLVSQDLVKLCRKIFHHCRGNYPKLRNITMNLDIRQARILKSNNTFDYWIKFANLNYRKQIFLPIKSYNFFENKKGILKKCVQIIVKPDKIEYAFVKDMQFETQASIKNKIIGIDTGIVVPLSTSTGHQYGLSLYSKLKRLDEQIVKLSSMRRKNGFYKNSPKLDRLYSKAKSLLKNEIGRISNEFLKKERPEEIVLENNKDITKSINGFSKRMKRLIQNSGITRLRNILIEKSEKLGIISSKINQAFTSQECPKCHCIQKDNRLNQKTFKCIKCGFVRNADYVASINIRNRRSITAINIYTSYKQIRELIMAFYKPLLVLQT